MADGSNPLKCEFLMITNRRSPLKFRYHIDDFPIKEVDVVKYLCMQEL